VLTRRHEDTEDAAAVWRSRAEARRRREGWRRGLGSPEAVKGWFLEVSPIVNEGRMLQDGVPGAGDWPKARQKSHTKARRREEEGDGTSRGGAEIAEGKMVGKDFSQRHKGTEGAGVSDSPEAVKGRAFGASRTVNPVNPVNLVHLIPNRYKAASRALATGQRPGKRFHTKARRFGRGLHGMPCSYGREVLSVKEPRRVGVRQAAVPARRLVGPGPG